MTQHTESASTSAPPEETLESLVEREKRFFNEQESNGYKAVRRVLWRTLGEFRRDRDIHDYYDPRGKVVLDYGCGPGYTTKRLLENGALHVTGMDVSEGEIEAARARAQRDGLADRAEFFVGDAHATGFPDDSFDLVIGQSILHHLDIRVALTEIRRVLKPGGSAVFLEPLAHNPLLRLGRALTPGGRTPDEHPLTERDWSLCGEVFEHVEHHEREFLTIPLMPLNLVLPAAGQRSLARSVGRIDERVRERFPAVRKYSRITLIVLS